MGGREVVDVAVVGAGPTGLLLAGDLARAGARVALLEKRTEESNLTRAFAVHARTLEHLDARGLADALVATGNAVDGLRLFGSVSVSFATLPSRFPFLLVTPQYHVERLLLARAVDAGVDLRRGARVVSLAQDEDGVRLDLESTRSPVRARYVVGTDGHHSTVRSQLGLDFPGRSVVRSLMLADVRMTQPPGELLTVVGNREGFCFVVPYGDGWYRLIARDPRREPSEDVPVSLDELRDLTRRVLGTDLGMHSPRWMSRFHSDERQVTSYRVGRVLLAGDAAHVHSPAGGMGMNTGLQDAANLGWKLAAVLDGRAEESLLDTYEAERKPIGASAVRTSGALIRVAMLRSRLARGARDLAFRRALGLAPVGARAALRISGIGLRYPAPPGQHDLVGSRAPDLTDRDGRRLHQSLDPAGFTLVAPGPVLARYASAAGLSTFAPAAPTPPVPGTAAMLVRPDGHVAWAGPAGQPLDDALRPRGAGS
ncbi:FAD-dependent monooxygenase [Nocardioides pantholopis]|uniref:FAD-dependent monooxygenase n=1 Tax=Nocardioides pantholopis TaxID=2483798 RepID=UPI000F088B25|nr:FAD-dependent monooxygenase [Nocardioides pantholopis]